MEHGSQTCRNASQYLVTILKTIDHTPYVFSPAALHRNENIHDRKLVETPIGTATEAISAWNSTKKCPTRRIVAVGEDDRMRFVHSGEPFEPRRRSSPGRTGGGSSGRQSDRTICISVVSILRLHLQKTVPFGVLLSLPPDVSNALCFISLLSRNRDAL